MQGLILAFIFWYLYDESVKTMMLHSAVSTILRATRATVANSHNLEHGRITTFGDSNHDLPWKNWWLIWWFTSHDSHFINKKGLKSDSNHQFFSKIPKKCLVIRIWLKNRSCTSSPWRRAPTSVRGRWRRGAWAASRRRSSASTARSSPSPRSPPPQSTRTRLQLDQRFRESPPGLPNDKTILL